ncbi:hypothetical protein POM88_025614 [Heracleum sosnowskyi]|uniref:RRM domain-containing protein n=1 Tax=Heracleum sosnowskyi TaxID=360622 RepID=A0AAD8MJY2_9APIA|nr:hypothetical protein POM88_025614 [Heracleum sosnowskyi]
MDFTCMLRFPSISRLISDLLPTISGVSSYTKGYGKVVEKVLKVSWDGIGEEYSVPRLRELFEVFGEVRYVLMRSCKINKGSAFIVMASKDVVVASTRSVVGYLDNPLLVLPVLRGDKYV